MVKCACRSEKLTRLDRAKEQKMKEITRTDISTEKQLDREIIELSKKNPTKYITYHAGFTKVWIYIHDRKPQGLNTGGAENCFRHHGGFFKNGEIVKPSNTFIRKFNFCPVSR